MRRALIAILAVLLLAPLVLPEASRADDTSIYGASTVTTIQPNVLIIFDNSGSMGTDDVPGDPYEPTTVYSGSYSTNAVYYYTKYYHYSSWQLLTDDVDNIGCNTMLSDLKAKGYAQGYINTYSPYACSNKGRSKQTLRTGNYMNYVASGGGAYQTRIAVAKQVITNLINKTSNVRFGLMVFNDSQGGHLVAPCGTDKTTLINDVNALTASTWTPLAETLAEAGLYFAGMPSWFNSYSGKDFYQNGRYVSPIQYPCQKNYVVIMTDGEPTQDNDSKLYSTPYINGDIIGDFNKDGLDSGPNAIYYADSGSDYLDDVADYLYTQDVDPSMGQDNPSFEQQHVITYTIGYTTDNDLLQRTAANGGGDYYIATNYSSLMESFDYIMSTIQQANGVFVAPVVPVNRMDRSYSGNKVYLGFFEPESGGNWFGNIKSYYLADNGDILNQDDSTKATDSNGLILNSAQSIWSSAADGPSVTKGGVGEVLQNRDYSTSPRQIYTYLSGNPVALTDTTNAFSLTNSAITDSLLNVADDTTKQHLFDTIYAPTASWRLGDFIHSEPVVVPYWNDANSNGVVDSGEMKSYIFAGSNDGMLHVFDDDTGSEVWAFIPPNELGQLYTLLDDNHDYFVDGSPSVYGWTDANKVDRKILLTGERRGGDDYFALDITNPAIVGNTTYPPSWAYQLGPQLLVNIDGDGNGTADGTAATLGQSWCQPTVHTIKVGDTTTDVFLLSGGYDANQDEDTPAANDTVGRAIYTVNATTGAVTGLDVNGGNFSSMTNCITDVGGFDTNGDGDMNRVYAGDLGGHIFALRDDGYTGTWEKRLFFELPDTVTAGGVTYTLGKKFMYAPDITEETYGDFVFIGTGDRAHPADTTHTDCLYAIKNDWATDSSAANGYKTLTVSDLTDVTDNLIQVGTSTQQTEEQTKLDNSSGWYMRLTHSGEKIVASPVVFGGKVFFTTYTPGTGTVSDTDPCDVASDRGVARLYVVDYKTGAAVNDLNQDDSVTGADRSMVIGTSIPSSPVVVVLPGGPRVLVGVEGGLQSQDSQVAQPIVQYYWRQLN